MDILEEDFEEVQQAPSAEKHEIPSVPETPAVEELPEKYRNKSPAELAKMHQEAEKLIGRHAQEVSEVRRLADQLIQNQFKAQPQAAKPEPKEDDIDEVDFFADPKSAIAKAVSMHPAILGAQEAAVKSQRQESLRSLQTNHADYKEIIGDSDFQDWVRTSKVRQQLFLAADRNYDFDAADELLSTYKQLRGKKTEATQEQVEEIRSSQRESLKAASNPAVGGSSEPAGKKIYRRADIIRMQIQQPDRYEDLQPEIMQAYAEGRVR